MKVKAAILFAALMSIHQPSIASEVCSSEKIVAPCETLASLKQNINGSKLLSLPEIDGGIIHNSIGQPLGSEDRIDPLTPLQLKQAEQIIETIREVAKREVSAGKAKEFWSKEQKAMVKRLETVRVEIIKTGSPECKPPEPGYLFIDAKYLPITHTIGICPNTAKLAPAAFKMLISHEFGHVISPCAMSREFYSNHNNILASKDGLKRCGFSDPSDQEFIDEIKSSKFAVFSPLEQLAPQYARNLKSLVSCKALSKQEDDGGFNEAGVFYEAGNCLDKAYGVLFNQYQAAIKDLVVPPVIRTDQSAKLPIKCLGAYEEHFAEAFASRVFAQMLAASKAKKEEARVGLIQMQSYACSERGLTAPPAVKYSYPSAKDRVHIQMSEAQTQKALGCELLKTEICNLHGTTGFRKQAPKERQQKSTDRTSISK